MFEKYTLYIGANNITRECETNKIITIASHYFDGFTLSPCTGYWKGAPEESARLEIVAESDKRAQVYALTQELKRVLEQEAIMVEASSADTNLSFI